MAELDADARGAFASLAGRSGLQAISQNNTDLTLDVLEVGSNTVSGLVPRLSLVGVERVTVRFARGGQPWRAEFELDTAEYHSDAQALVGLRLLDIQSDGTGRVAPRVAVHAPGMLTASYCQNAVRGNTYTVRVDDVSSTGLQFSTEVALMRGDQFSLTFEAGGRRVHLDAEAMSVRPGPYNRHVVGARITGSGAGDMAALNRLIAGE
jgi:PilZ domain-containing protein